MKKPIFKTLMTRNDATTGGGALITSACEYWIKLVSDDVVVSLHWWDCQECLTNRWFLSDRIWCPFEF